MDLSVIPERASKYSREQVAEAVFTYFCEGTAARTAEVTGIPNRTIQHWRNQEWWHKALTAACEENQDRLDAFCGQIIDRALHTARDRLDNGDYKLDKHGELHRVPVSGRDATWIGAVWFDKQRILRGLATSITDNKGSSELANRLRELEHKAESKVVSSDD